MTDDAIALLRRLIACDTSNPPGRETAAAAIVEDELSGSGVECVRVAKDADRANLLCRLPGRGDGPSLAFLGHLDVVRARREDWSVEPFAGIERDGAIWGRGAIDMKCQVAATVTALRVLAEEGFRPGGDLLVLLMADEEVGDAAVGSPFFVEELPDLRPDYVVGEGAGERFQTPAGPLYLLDCGVKATSSATVTVRGAAGDASLPDLGRSALREAARLLERLAAYESPLRVPRELRPLLDLLAPGDAPDAERVAAVRRADPALDRVVAGLTGTVLRATAARADGPANVVPEEATIDLQCLVLPGVTRGELEAELRDALGDGDYELEVEEPMGGLVSAAESPLRDAIEGFLAEHDPEAKLVPALGYGFSDCHVLREAYGSTVYGFIPFRHAAALDNLERKHAVDERVLAADVEFQLAAALHVARAVGSPEALAVPSPV